MRRHQPGRLRSDGRYRALFEGSASIMLLVDPRSAAVVDANVAAATYYGLPREDLIGRRITDLDLRPADEVRAVLAHVRGRTRFEARHRRGGGDVGDVEVYVAPAAVGGRPLLSLVVHDVTARREAERQLRHQVLHDPVTGLPNRLLLFDRLEHALARAQRRRAPLAVLFCDLDRFKLVNDGLGHQAGDALLVAVAQRLASAIRPSDTLARYGGDEFVALCEDVDEPAAVGIARRLAEALARPFPLAGRSVRVSASIGMALSHGNGHVDGLVREADSAMYRAKERGRDRLVVVDTSPRVCPAGPGVPPEQPVPEPGRLPERLPEGSRCGEAQ